ncbi:MAG TPA: TRAP transporter TatT component family protein [Polyangiaceae bacterium]|nr:TRAP transporter TatT component family protein [Polyangiaceae bacterium]
MSSARGIVGAALAAVLSLTTTGCIRKVLIDGQVSSTRQGADAVNTLHDFEVARAVARSGLATLEGMYKLAPYNEDALLMLTRGWAGATFAFTEDEWEQAEEGKDDATTAYHLARTVAGFQRAKFFGTQLLNQKASGFDAAQRNSATMNEWLRRNFVKKEEAEDLTWIAYAFVGLVGAAKDNPEVVSNLYIGVAIAERALQLDEQFEHGMNHILLGAYHARTAQSELDEAKQHFDAAMKINGGKFLPTQLNYASRYYCAKSDRANYEKMLNAVLAAGDPIPEARLQNLIAKRRARRYLDSKVFQEDCGFID